MTKNKCIYLIVGPSGSGKTSVCNLLSEKYGLKMLDSYTTRAPRYDGELGHIFVTKEEFDRLQNKCAYTLFDGNEYCATSAQVDKADLYVIDPAGIEYFCEHYAGEKIPVLFIFDVSAENSIKRMRERGDSAEKIIDRYLHDVEAFENVANVATKYKLEYIWLNSNEYSVECLSDEIIDTIQYMEENNDWQDEELKV